MRLIDADELKIDFGFTWDDIAPTREEMFEIIDRQPTAELKKSKWTPCRERLPKAEKRSYWICTDTEYQCMCRWINSNPFWVGRETDWHWNIFDIPQYTTVVAWRELPEPYKEDENGIS